MRDCLFGVGDGAETVGRKGGTKTERVEVTDADERNGHLGCVPAVCQLDHARTPVDSPVDDEGSFADGVDGAVVAKGDLARRMKGTVAARLKGPAMRREGASSASVE